MARRAELVGVVKPEVDDRTLDRQSQKVSEAMDKAANLTASIDTRALQRKLERAIPGGGVIGGVVDRVRGGGGPRRGGDAAGAAGGAAGGAVQLKQLEKLDDIHEELEKIGASGGAAGGGGGGGGGGIGGLLGGLGLARLATGGAGIGLGTAGLAGTVAAGTVGAPLATMSQRVGRLFGGDGPSVEKLLFGQAPEFIRNQRQKPGTPGKNPNLVYNGPGSNFEWPEPPTLDQPDWLSQLSVDKPTWLSQLSVDGSSLFGGGGGGAPTTRTTVPETVPDRIAETIPESANLSTLFGDPTTDLSKTGRGQGSVAGAVRQFEQRTGFDVPGDGPVVDTGGESPIGDVNLNVDGPTFNLDPEGFRREIDRAIDEAKPKIVDEAVREVEQLVPDVGI